MVEHESVDPKAQGKPDLGTGVTNQVMAVGGGDGWGKRGGDVGNVDCGERSGGGISVRCVRARGVGVCEVVVGPR